MKKIKSLLSIAVCALIVTSCTCYRSAAADYPISTDIKSSTVVDLDVSAKKITYTYSPTAEVYSLGIQNVINTAVEKALKENGNADVLVGMRYYIEGKRVGFNSYIVYEITVTGFPAFYRNFRPSSSASSSGVKASDDSKNVDNVAKNTQTIVIDNPANVTAIQSSESYPSIESDTRYKDVEYYGDVLTNVPSSFKGDFIVQYGASSIGKYAFQDCEKITTIRMPHSVTTIDKYAFSGCSGLTSIEVSSNLTSIGDYAFENCENLKTITLSSSITKVGKMLFAVVRTWLLYMFLKTK